MQKSKRVIDPEKLFVSIRDDININGSNLAKIRRHIKDAPSVDFPKTPCDLCRFNPPSSFDGKPCSVCPAEGVSNNE